MGDMVAIFHVMVTSSPIIIILLLVLRASISASSLEHNQDYNNDIKSPSQYTIISVMVVFKICDSYVPKK